MDSYKMITPMLMILLQCTIHVFGQMKFVDERFVNKTNIITRIPFTTITSCFMKCSQHEKCSAVGFSTDPTASRNSDCLLLEKIEDFGVEKAEGLVPMFVMMDEKEIDRTKHVIPDCPVDGGYSDWSAYTMCSTTCGNGIQNRTRQCNNPFPKGTGSDCSILGSPSENKTCNVMSCPIDGGWSTWGSYSTCSTTCGDGQKTRTRTCTNPPPQYEGKDCKDSSSASSSCRVVLCAPDFCKPAYLGHATSTVLQLYNSQGGIINSGSVSCTVKDGYHYTVFSHDAHTTRSFYPSYNPKMPINYSPSNSFVKAAVPYFDYCYQAFSWNQDQNYPPISCFFDRHGLELCMNNALCKGCPKKETRSSGHAFIDDRSVLPLTYMWFKDNDNSGEFFNIALQYLICR